MNAKGERARSVRGKMGAERDTDNIAAVVPGAYL